MSRSIAFYEKLLFGYLAGYAVLHVASLIFLAFFERGWGLFAYLWVFAPHLPLFLVASLVALLGKKRQQSVVWLVTVVLFILSNAWWLYSGLQGGAYLTYFFFIVVTVIPIVTTAQLMLLTKTDISHLPKV